MSNKIKTFRPILTCIFALLVCLNSSFANENAEGAVAEPTHEEKFKPTEVIFEHISDSHDWHFWGEHEHAVSLPLPVIIYSDKGFDVFLSSAFHHGTHPYHGKYTYILKNDHVKVVDETEVVDEAATSKIIDHYFKFVLKHGRRLQKKWNSCTKRQTIIFRTTGNVCSRRNCKTKHWR
jgi:F-type H+-transporting ATPase subunit a